MVILELSVILVNSLGFLEGSDGEDVLTLLVHGNTVVEEGLPGAGVILLKMFLADNGQTVPVLLVKHVQADFLKDKLFLDTKLLFAGCEFFIIIIFFVILGSTGNVVEVHVLVAGAM